MPVDRKAVPTKTRNEVFDKTDDRCWFCGCDIDFHPWCYRSRKNVEHLTPVSRGGTNDLDNLVPACFHCNSRKRDQTLEEYRAEFHLYGGPKEEWWWLRFVPNEIGGTDWFSHDGEEELMLSLRRVLARLAQRTVVFYGECMNTDPNNYCI